MKTLLFSIGILALVGCNSLKPTGPFVKDVPITQQGQPIPSAPTDASPPPPLRPTPPTLMIAPNDVRANPYDAASKLASEVSIDGKAQPNFPVTVETSKVKGGTK